MRNENSHMPDPAFLTVEDVATLLSVHPDTVRKWIKNRQLKAINLGTRAGYRISRADLDEFIRARQEHSGQDD
jgi:excisionase family DNA binding protein